MYKALQDTSPRNRWDAPFCCLGVFLWLCNDLQTVNANPLVDGGFGGGSGCSCCVFAVWHCFGLLLG